MTKRLREIGSWWRNWSTWKPVANWRLVTTSYVWLFIVPVAVRVVRPLSNVETVTIPWVGQPEGKAIEVAIGLPFTWWVFFFMALSFVLGRILYAWSAPGIVKHYDSFGHFRRECTDDRILCDLNRWVVERAREAGRRLLCRGAVTAHGQNADSLGDDRHEQLCRVSDDDDQYVAKFLEMTNRAAGLMGDDEKPKGAYFRCLLDVAAKHIRVKKCFATAVVFSLGFALLTVVVVQNLYAVCTYLVAS